jgi:hypothetical protein
MFPTEIPNIGKLIALYPAYDISVFDHYAHFKDGVLEFLYEVDDNTYTYKELIQTKPYPVKCVINVPCHAFYVDEKESLEIFRGYYSFEEIIWFITYKYECGNYDLCDREKDISDINFYYDIIINQMYKSYKVFAESDNEYISYNEILHNGYFSCLIDLISEITNRLMTTSRHMKKVFDEMEGFRKNHILICM